MHHKSVQPNHFKGWLHRLVHNHSGRKTFLAEEQLLNQEIGIDEFKCQSVPKNDFSSGLDQ